MSRKGRRKMSRKTVKILIECVMCTILIIIMTIGAYKLWEYQHGEPPVKEQSK